LYSPCLVYESNVIYYDTFFALPAATGVPAYPAICPSQIAL
jgi:hypothetical protein